MEINCDGADVAGVTARWVRTGTMDKARANHSATYVPPGVAGSLYPKGYIVIMGGCVDGANSDSVSLVDLSNFHWSEVAVQGHGPRAQNSHTATLIVNPGGNSESGILLLGGGTGDGNNGGPPRGGQDCAGAYWLTGLGGKKAEKYKEHEAGNDMDGFESNFEGVQFRWSQVSSEVLGGRGHVAMRLSGTSTVVRVGGGKRPSAPLGQAASAVDCHSHFGSRNLQLSSTSNAQPVPRAFGGGCALPDGLILVYGGWHPSQGTWSDIWAGCFDEVGRTSTFFQQLPVGQPVEPESSDEEAPGDELFHVNRIREVQRLLSRLEGFGPMEHDEARILGEHEDPEALGGNGETGKLSTRNGASTDTMKQLSLLFHYVLIGLYNLNCKFSFILTESPCPEWGRWKPLGLAEGVK